MGLDGEGPVFHYFRRVEAPEAHLQVGGRNDDPVFIGLQEKITQDGHGPPTVHHSQGPSDSLQQRFPIDLQLHKHFLLKV